MHIKTFAHFQVFIQNAKVTSLYKLQFGVNNEMTMLMGLFQQNA